jgi:regulatory protein
MAKTVSAIKQQKRNPQRVNIYLDGEYAFPLSKIVAAWLKIGQVLSDEKIAELQGQDDSEKAFQRALNFISYRPRSQAEVERNLRKFEVSEEVIPAIIERLRAGGLLNDSDFARRWVEDRGAFRPRGAYALRMELRQKGLAETDIEAALQDLDESQLAQQAAERKLRQLSGLDWMQFRTKLSAHLARRGFGYETVVEATRAAWEQLQSSQHSNAAKFSLQRNED